MYELYFDKVLLPIAPGKFKTKIKNKNKTIELVNEGEVNLLKAPGLTELSFSLTLPNQQYSFAVYRDGFKEASYYLDILKKYKQSRKPFQFILSRVAPNGKVLFYTNMKVSLEDYNLDESAKEGTDIIVPVTLLQYKDFGTKTVNLDSQSKPTTTQTRPPGKGGDNSGKTYTVLPGDTLWNIAKLKMGNGSYSGNLYASNKETIEKVAKSRGKASSNNGQWIYPGTALVIPAVSASMALKPISSKTVSDSGGIKAVVKV